MAELPFYSTWPKPLRILLARPRLSISVLVGVATASLLPPSLALHEITRLIVAWNAGTCLYLLLAIAMMFRSSHERMRARALEEDEGRIVLLALVVISSLISLGAIVAELAVVKDLHGMQRYAHVALVALTINIASSLL